MDNIYFNCVLTKKIIVQSKYLNENIDEYINNYIKTNVENYCVHEGYIKPDSVKILKKSVGILLGSRFTGDITYEVAYTAQVCNPVVGNIIECKVKFVNKLGILGNNGPITIIIGKQFHANDNELNKLGENDIVKVEVIAKKFSLNDKEIKIIAKLWNENESLNTKKKIVSSDLTPIITDNDFIDLDNQADINYNSEDNEEYSMEDVDEDEDIYSEEEEEEEIKLQNPDEAQLDADDIELEDTEDTDDYEEDTDSVN